jgi:hypothetical protein
MEPTHRPLPRYSEVPLSSRPTSKLRGQARRSLLPFNSQTYTSGPPLSSSNHDPCRGSSIGRACGSYNSKEINLKVVGSSPTFGYSYHKLIRAAVLLSFLDDPGSVFLGLGCVWRMNLYRCSVGEERAGVARVDLGRRRCGLVWFVYFFGCCL